MYTIYIWKWTETPALLVGTRTLCFLKFLLCFALILHDKANYAHCFTPIMLSLYGIVQVSTHHKPVSLPVASPEIYRVVSLDRARAKILPLIIFIATTSLQSMRSRSIGRQTCTSPVLTWHKRCTYDEDQALQTQLTTCSSK